ncbi:MAG TPA: hypothetical protein VGR35_04775 [Tepidisphaeraceae bacterium]|nr:hypothetical protein [Tepidisphaeraceae bacterium]
MSPTNNEHIDLNDWLTGVRIDAAIASVVLAGFFIRPSWLWREKRIGIVTALRELGVV